MRLRGDPPLRRHPSSASPARRAPSPARAAAGDKAARKAAKRAAKAAKQVEQPPAAPPVDADSARPPRAAPVDALPLDDPLASREAALWDRQERLWAREMARWDAERAAADARERALLAALASLQAELARVTALLPGGDGAAAAAAAAVPAPAEETARADAAPAAAAAPPPPAAGPTFADHLAAAKAAVEHGDVLADEYGGHGELLGKGKAAAAAAAAAPPPAAAATPPPPSPPPPTRPPWEVTPPTLAQGADDIFWVNALQRGLDAAALHCGDDEAEDFYFGAGTRAALETFQAMAGLPETGVADADTWRALYGDALADLRPPDDAAVAAADAVAAARAAPAPPAPPSPPPPAGSVTVETWTEHRVTVEPTPAGPRVTETDVDAAAVIVTPARDPARAAWPILRDGDGGRHVHELHVALNRAGFHCGDDDEQWWQFGDSTYSALVTFQACSSLPESGVADAATWLALLGPDATPADGAALSAGNATDDDMLGPQHEGAVYLIGEQRWARKVEAPPDRE